MKWRLRDRWLDVGQRALVMGIVNVTPDSFSDGGRFVDSQAAIAHGLELIRQGADVLDVGGESTRPGAEAVDADEELRRVRPVIEGLRAASDIPLSIDTSKASVAAAALEAGADVVNDVTAGRDLDMASVVARYQAGVVLMHMQGTPRTMQIDPRYDDVVADIRGSLKERIDAFVAAGAAFECIAVDPGIGFGKTHAHNVELLARLPEFLSLGRPICLGVSRKGFIGEITGRPRDQRDAASAIIAAYGLTRGAVHVVRAHDVSTTRDAVRLISALKSFERSAT